MSITGTTAYLVERHSGLHETDGAVAEAVVDRSIFSRDEKKPCRSTPIVQNNVLLLCSSQGFVETILKDELSDFLALVQ